MSKKIFTPEEMLARLKKKGILESILDKFPPFFARDINDGTEIFSVFHITDCEECGDVTSTSTIGMVHTRAEMIEKGFVELTEVPEEIGYCEEIGKCTCLDCFVPDADRNWNLDWIHMRA